jgi:hypothetical protein
MSHLISPLARSDQTTLAALRLPPSAARDLPRQREPRKLVGNITSQCSSVAAATVW